MRLNFRYSSRAVAMVAAAFGLFGPAAAQAGQTPGTSMPACAGACDLKAPAAHLSGMAGASTILTSVIKRSSDSNGYGRDRLGLPGQRQRMLQRSDRCGWWYGHWRCGDRDDYRHGGYDHYRHRDYDHYGHGDYDHYGHGDYDHYGHGDYDRYGHGDYHHGGFHHYR